MNIVPNSTNFLFPQPGLIDVTALAYCNAMYDLHFAAASAAAAAATPRPFKLSLMQLKFVAASLGRPCPHEPETITFSS